MEDFRRSALLLFLKRVGKLLHLLPVMHVSSGVAGPAIILSQQNQTLFKKPRPGLLWLSLWTGGLSERWLIMVEGKQTVGRICIRLVGIIPHGSADQLDGQEQENPRHQRKITDSALGLDVAAPENRF